MMYNKRNWFESPVQAAITMQPKNLQGLGSAGQLNVQMPDGSGRIFYGITTDLDAALRAGGRPWWPNPNDYNVIGGYYTVTQFQGGWLLDGCPLNVIFGQGWMAGQQDALSAAGIIPNCRQVAMQPVTQQQTVNQQAAPGATYTPQNAPLFTTTSGGSGIVTIPSSAAPQQTVYSSQTPISPIPMQSYVDQSGEAPPASAMPDWLPIAAVAVIAILLLRRG